MTSHPSETHSSERVRLTEAQIDALAEEFGLDFNGHATWIVDWQKFASRVKAVWDEGYAAGHSFGYEWAQDTYDGPSEDPTPNPYESLLVGGEES